MHFRQIRKPSAARKLHGSVFYRTGVIADLQLYIVRIENFALFCCCDLDLDQMTFIYELDPYSPKMYSQTENELSTSRL